MKLILWNVNGIRSVFNKGFETFVINEKPDILCLQEIKANQDQLSFIQDSLYLDYKVFFSSALRKGYSGVATFAHRNHPIEAENIKKGISLPHFDCEGRFLITPLKSFDLYNIYFPSGTSGELRQQFKYTFLDSVYEYFKNLSPAQRSRAIVCGDFNICHKEIDIHHPAVATKRALTGFLPQERAWMDLFSELGFKDSFRHRHGDRKDSYSWWSYRANSRQKNLGWRIDYFFVHQALLHKISNAEILSNIYGSDHCPITLELADL